MKTDPPRLSTREVAHLLGVKPATVYAYVSRGLLGSHRNADGKGSLFDRAEVDAFLAARNHTTTPGIRTGITLIQDGTLHYRGQDAVQLARVASFEEVVLSEAVIAPLPHTARHTDRLRVIVAAAAAGDPLRFDTSPAAVIATGRTLLGTMVAALPPARRAGPARANNTTAGEPLTTPTASNAAAGKALTTPAANNTAAGKPLTAATANHATDGDPLPAPDHYPAPPPRLAERLWPRLTTRPPTPQDINLLDAALILLADHDIAASTLAARVAASTRAHPYAVVGAGLAALDGPLHGAASGLAHDLLADALTRPDPVGAIAGTVRPGEPVPGFGHRLYPDGDPRASALLDMLGDTRARAAADRVAHVMRTRSGLEPNVDLALAALALEHDMPADASETIFAIARTAGWLAHALEEYADRPSRFRPSGEYSGRTPAGDGR
ncbi:citrate/2-methylcitrate synthase [Paractinoplanes maris]|uniref:citrate/2-methylcitrate synthase n=1 Tax=Paractinoplanes maris TaxID=1734446 RepID=UPI002022241F|nr:citrate/2-methylcitrate synthase [Actinoplanes maris]